MTVKAEDMAKVTLTGFYLPSVFCPATLASLTKRLQDILDANPDKELRIGFGRDEGEAACQAYIDYYRPKSPEEQDLEARAGERWSAHQRALEKAQYLALKEKYGDGK